MIEAISPSRAAVLSPLCWRCTVVLSGRRLVPGPTGAPRRPFRNDCRDGRLSRGWSTPGPSGPGSPDPVVCGSRRWTARSSARPGPTSRGAAPGTTTAPVRSSGRSTGRRMRAPPHHFFAPTVWSQSARPRRGTCATTTSCSSPTAGWRCSTRSSWRTAMRSSPAVGDQRRCPPSVGRVPCGWSSTVGGRRGRPSSRPRGTTCHGALPATVLLLPGAQRGPQPPARQRRAGAAATAGCCHPRPGERPSGPPRPGDRRPGAQRGAGRRHPRSRLARDHRVGRP